MKRYKTNSEYRFIVMEVELLEGSNREINLILS